MGKADTLIRTKLRLPFTRPGQVPRPRLQDQITQGMCGPLTLITAPAGFGKTTLVASCVNSCGMPVAWLSLDQDDNREGRFLNYLVAALQEADHTIGSEAAQLLAASQQALSEAILTSLINDLDTTGREISLVLDDYQFIKSQDVHEAVAFLLEHCPKTFHLVIASRSDPLLPLTRLRGRGQVVELRGNNLRFTTFEAAQYLNDVMSLGLNDRWVAVLEERTEGWIAGLQMAALSIRNRDNVGEFIEGFSGTNRYILDYLLEEVLASQPLEIQNFLLCTSILERLTAPLCEALLQVEKLDVEIRDRLSAAFQPANLLNCQPVLEHLERANLFLVPLDDERKWYRYHHLFAELLRTQLDQLYPGLAPQLHGRAAYWLEQEGITVEAINHALAAGEYDHAAHLVEENTSRLMAQGELSALMGWIESLPAELRTRRPWLCVHQANALTFAGRTPEVEPLLTQVEEALAVASAQGASSITDQADETYALSMGMDEVLALKGSVAAIRALVAVTTGRDAEAISQAQQVFELVPAENLWERSSAAWAIGYARWSQGSLPEAKLAFEEQIRLGRAMHNIWTVVAGVNYLAQVLRTQGELLQARALYEAALSEASQEGARSLGYIAIVETSLAAVLFEQDELETAQSLLAEAITHTHRWPNPVHMAYAYALQARVLLAQGNLQEAWRSIGKADQISRSPALTRIIRRMVETDLVRVLLALQAAGIQFKAGDPLVNQADAFLDIWRNELAGQGEGDTARMDEGAEIAALTLARVSLAARRAEEALSQLEIVTRSARAAGHIETVISSLVLSAIAWQANSSQQVQCSEPVIETGHSVPALAALEEALCLAEPGGYARVFLDEGNPMQRLLKQWLVNTGDNPLRAYAVHLLSQFDTEPQMIKAVQVKVFPTGGLVEPLSQRELEVLHHMALGRTNQEIASQLIVSPGTVKAHTASIYRKLDVANRTEAVAHARQLGLLP
jgi:LuxR family maltose regulon positive regulatory protein